MNIFFFGATELGLSCFKKILDMGYTVSGCAYTGEKIIVRKKPEGIKNYTYVDFKEVAADQNIPAIEFDKNKQELFYNELLKLKPDLIIVAGWHYLIASNILDMPGLGAIGLHASLLPEYRGGSPLVWQLINGEKNAGISLFYLESDGGVDTGHIIGQESFSIEDDDTIKELLIKSEKSGIALLEKYLPLIEKGISPKIKQDESKATVYRQRVPSDGKINWDDSPTNIRNFIRAQTKPYPGAYTVIDGKKVIIWDADISEVELEQ